MLTLPTVDHIAKKIISLGRGSHIFIIDVSRAFRHIKIDPKDYVYLGLKNGDYFLDSSLPFGFRHGTNFFQRLSDSIRYMASHNHGCDVINYVDDICGFSLPSESHKKFLLVKKFIENLGLDIFLKKLVPPSTKTSCLGVVFDTTNFTMSVPEERLAKIRYVHHGCIEKNCTKKQLQSLLGSLLYVSKCIKVARIFLSRMLNTLRNHFSDNIITLDEEFKKDLNWFAKLLPKFNGVSFFEKRPIKATIELDASLTGLGARFDQFVYALPLSGALCDMGIVHLEMINNLLALRFWGKAWKNSKVIIKCDNQAVVLVLTSGRSRDMLLCTIARNIL